MSPVRLSGTSIVELTGLKLTGMRGIGMLGIGRVAMAMARLRADVSTMPKAKRT
jgi:hypothetical protein